MPFQIPYFARAIVNRRFVLVDHVLQAGDRLVFMDFRAGRLGPPGYFEEENNVESFLRWYLDLDGVAEEVKREGIACTPDAAQAVKPLDVGRTYGPGPIDKEIDAESLLRWQPDLYRMAEAVKQEAKKANLDAHQSIDLMAARLIQWCEDRFGPLVQTALPMINEVVPVLSSLGDIFRRFRDGDEPRRPGRKNTTKELADFVYSRRRQGDPYKVIAAAWNDMYPDKGKVSADKASEALRRRHGDKAKRKRHRDGG
jgi:hypothetical protein